MHRHFGLSLNVLFSLDSAGICVYFNCLYSLVYAAINCLPDVNVNVP